MERLRTNVLWHQRRRNDTIARDCQEAADEIERLRGALLLMRGRLLMENPHAVTTEADALLLVPKQAHEVERLRGIVPEVLERLNDELCAENERLRAVLQALVNALNSGHSLTIFDALTGAEAVLGPNVRAKPPMTAAQEHEDETE